MCMLSIDHKDAIQPMLKHSIHIEWEISQYILFDLSLFVKKDIKINNHLDHGNPDISGPKSKLSDQYLIEYQTVQYYYLALQKYLLDLQQNVVEYSAVDYSAEPKKCVWDHPPKPRRGLPVEDTI